MRNTNEDNIILAMMKSREENKGLLETIRTPIVNENIIMVTETLDMMKTRLFDPSIIRTFWDVNIPLEEPKLEEKHKDGCAVDFFVNGWDHDVVVDMLANSEIPFFKIVYNSDYIHLERNSSAINVVIRKGNERS